MRNTASLNFTACRRSEYVDKLMTAAVSPKTVEPLFLEKLKKYYIERSGLCSVDIRQSHSLLLYPLDFCLSTLFDMKYKL
ncbi:hypothetical protein RUMCAL_02235 [Ruminococcus callidus ATCC 27760]|uniref:Uncharacterized protein n=1 Tax=Ruminococcus callidus ATCC 27760 TaxID=411473 RepID=U2KNS9_9FIRM|nr:hypothetical protein RUMCAL_02235 [Ruminococcus callidus ATCC 27760]